MRKIIKIILFIILLCLIGISIYYFISSKNKETTDMNTVTYIKKHYNEYVKTNKESILYDKNNKEIGKINKDINIKLDKTNINKDTTVFKITGLDYYIKYQDVEPVEEFKIDDSYNRYIPFNSNVVTTDKTTFYNENGYVYEINTSIDLPIIIKDKDKYYVSYNNELLYVKKNEVKVKDHKNSNEVTRNDIRVLTYHAVYKDGEKCKNKDICEKYDMFESQIKYLADNNYLALTMRELELFLDKKINIPKKSIVITLDDGNLAKNAVEVLDKYKINATFFIITGRYEDALSVPTEYVDYQSHTDNLHNNYKCPGGEQGGQLLCEKEENIKKDLELSRKKIQEHQEGEVFALSYPFFDWNQRAVKILKESGFRLAFIGEWDNGGMNNYNTNRMLLHRKTIFASDSLETFKSYLN